MYTVSILALEDVCNGDSCPGRLKHWWRSIPEGDDLNVLFL